MKKIIVKIHKGKTTVQAEGYAGVSCKDATNAFEKALGQVTEDTETDEMYMEIDQEYINENGG